MVKYNEVDGGKSGAGGKSVKKLSKKSKKPQKPEKSAKSIGSKKPTFLTFDTRLPFTKMGSSRIIEIS